MSRPKKFTKDQIREKRKVYWQMYYAKNKESLKLRSNLYKKSDAGKKNTKIATTKHQYASPQNRIKRLVLNVKARAKRYSTVFDEVYMRSLAEAPPDLCICCSRKLNYLTPPNKTNHSSLPSFDRLNPKLGYIKANVKLICFKCNTMKSDGSEQEVLAILNYIRNSRQ